MTKTKKVLTYNVEEVAEMLGMAKLTIMNQIKNDRFAFPVLQIAENRWVIPRKAVDNFLLQGTDRRGYGSHNSKTKKWIKGEYVTWNFKLPKDLSEAFKIVVDDMNKRLATPINYEDARRLAVQEFVERRPIEGD